jgi:large subunit ribosomal protein L1
MDFDLIISHPKFMPELSKLGKILGPKGLMPNPKMGTVSADPIKAAKEFKKGKLNYKMDTYGNIHVVIGKVSASADKVIENIKTFLEYLNSRRPSTIKGDFIQKVCISSSMGPSIKLVFK